MQDDFQTVTIIAYQALNHNIRDQAQSFSASSVVQRDENQIVRNKGVKIL